MCSLYNLFLIACSLPAMMVSGERILFLTTMMKSRVLQANSIAEGLLENGHQVYMAINTKFNTQVIMDRSGIEFLHYRSSGAGEELLQTSYHFQKIMFEVSFTGVSFSTVRRLLPSLAGIYAEECEVVQNKTFYAELERLNFDLIVVDATMRCLLLIPHNLGVPYVNYLPIVLPDMVAPALHTPILVPSGLMDRVYLQTSPLSMRIFKATIVYLLFPILDYLMAMPSDKPYTSLRSLADGASLHLIDTARVFDVPVPLSPNVINVGGLVTKPATQLKEGPLKDFVDSSDSFILVTFGGVAVHLPDHIIDILLEGIGKLKLRVVLQLNANNLKKNQRIPPNTYAAKWLPQNDLLGHRKIKVFVTHCGNSGQHEALYHGVPMLGLPIFGDQAYNADRLASKGFGLYIPLRDVTVDGFVSNITELVQSQRYKQAITKASEMYRDQPMTPKQTAAYWIDHVLKYGDDHLRSFTNQLSWYQVLMWDVVAVILTVILLIFAVFYACCRWVCCRKQQDTKAVKKKAA